MAGDPYFDSVALLLPMTGVNNSTTFTDYSPVPKPVTAFGNAKISNVQSKWGEGSGYFDGTGDYLTFPSITIANDNFCIETWLYKTAINPTGAVWLSSAGSGHRFTLDAGGAGRIGLILNGSTVTSSGNGVVALNQWQHVAFTRESGIIRCFVNGTLIWSVAYTLGFNVGLIGRYSQANYYELTGYLQDLRITVGAARYTANFTPPTASLVFEQVPIAGNCIVSSNGGAEQVVIRDWVTRELQAIATPASNGDWTAEVPVGQYDITYFAAGCQPICHGPYTVTAN